MKVNFDAVIIDLNGEPRSLVATRLWYVASSTWRHCSACRPTGHGHVSADSEHEADCGLPTVGQTLGHVIADEANSPAEGGPHDEPSAERQCGVQDRPRITRLLWQ